MSPASIVKNLWNYCNKLRDYVERPTCHMCPHNRSRPGKRAVARACDCRHAVPGM